MQPTEPTLAQARALLAAVTARCGESVATSDAAWHINAAAFYLAPPRNENERTNGEAADRHIRSAIAVLIGEVNRHAAMDKTPVDIPALIAALEAKDA